MNTAPLIDLLRQRLLAPLNFAAYVTWAAVAIEGAGSRFALPASAAWMGLFLAGFVWSVLGGHEHGQFVAMRSSLPGMVLLLVINRIRTGKVTPLLAISTVLVLVFGAVTLWLRDERFIQWKPTVFFWAIGLAFLASQWIGAKPFAQRLMEAAMGELRVPDPAWRTVNVAWVVFYAAMGAANLFVARSFSEQFWVNFKAFGLKRRFRRIGQRVDSPLDLSDRLANEIFRCLCI